MDVLETINLLKKYNLYDEAEAECRRRKIDKAPYDMQGHHEVYCKYLSKKWVELRDKKSELQKVKCKEWDNIPEEKKPAHDVCMFVEMSLRNECCSKCEYYKTIKELQGEMKTLTDAEKCLKAAADYDFTWR
mgnify:FL=1